MEEEDEEFLGFEVNLRRVVMEVYGVCLNVYDILFCFMIDLFCI